MTATLSDLERLLAFEDLRTLRGRYWRYVDTKRWKEFGELFAPDAAFTDHSADFSCSTRDGITEGISAALHGVRSIHQGQQSELEILSPDSARGIWSLADILHFSPESSNPGMTLRGWGHYVDDYVKIEGRWLFRTIDLYRLHVETITESATDYPPDFSITG